MVFSPLVELFIIVAVKTELLLSMRFVNDTASLLDEALTISLEAKIKSGLVINTTLTTIQAIIKIKAKIIGISFFIIIPQKIRHQAFA